VLSPSDTHRKYITSFTAVLLPFMTYLLSLSRIFSFFFFGISGVGLSPLGTAATSGLLYKPQMIDEGDCGELVE
jgi:hypothetical protein